MGSVGTRLKPVAASFQIQAANVPSPPPFPDTWKFVMCYLKVPLRVLVAANTGSTYRPSSRYTMNLMCIIREVAANTHPCGYFRKCSGSPHDPENRRVKIKDTDTLPPDRFELYIKMLPYDIRIPKK